MDAGGIVIRRLGPADAAPYRTLRLDSLRNFPSAHGHQRGGIGRLLVAHLIDFARSLGHVRRLTLTLIDGNVPARRLYDAVAFQPFGLEPDAIFHEGRYLAQHHLHLPLVSQATP